MTQCPLAYTDPCSECAQFGNCSPSQTLQKITALEDLLQDLKKMLQCIVDKK